MRRQFDIAAVLILFVIGAVAGNYSYRVFLDVRGNPLDTLLPEFKPAALFAAGHGMIIPTDLDAPALDAFLALEQEAFDADDLPDVISGTHLLAGARDSFPLSHWLLFYSVGWCWRLFGISHESLRLLSALFYGLTAMALYCLFRLGMGRALSVAGAFCVALLPPFLAVAPLLRDFSKAPFILFFIALAGFMLKHRSPVDRLLKYGVIAGALVGVGYGFRQDMLICLPVALFVIVTAPIQGGWRPLYRAAALALISWVFLLSAAPVLLGVREDAGSVSTHTLFQGLSRLAEQQMDFGDAAYDLLLRPDDTETHAVVNAHARLRGFDAPMDLYLSPAYGRAGRELFREWARAFPADLFARGLAAMEATTRLSTLTNAYHAYEPIAESEWGRRLRPYHTFYQRYIERFGLIFICVALFLIAMRDKGRAVLLTLCVGWFMAYPNLLFEVRHAFHLAFITPWAALLVATQAARGGWAWCCSVYAGNRRVAPGLKDAALSAGALFVAAAVMTTGVLLALRVVQTGNAARMMAAYNDAPLERVATDTIFEGANTLVAPREKLPELRESWNLPVGDVAVAYLALELAPSEYPTVVTLLYEPGRGANFTRQILVSAREEKMGNALYFVPVYEMANFMPVMFSTLKRRFSNAPIVNLLTHRWGVNNFLGIQMHKDDAPRLVAMHRVTDIDTLPWLFYLRGETTTSGGDLFKRMRVEKAVYALPVEVRLRITGDRDMALQRYFTLLNHFPYYRYFANRIASLSNNIPDDIDRAEALFRLARHVPERASVIARDVAEIGDVFHEKDIFDTAGDMYARALRLAPRDLGYQVKLADVLRKRGDYESALENYATVLWAAPESPYTATQFESLCLAQMDADRLLAFWRELSNAYPDAAEPMLRLGRELERRGHLEEALTIYQRITERHPDHAPALLHYGVLVAVEEGYARGRAMMDRAVEIDLELEPNLVAGLTRIAARHMETGAHAFAEAIYREVMERAPEEGQYQVHYAEALFAQENYDMAAAVFMDIIEREPESPYPAHKLDVIFEVRNDHEGYVQTWQALHQSHPDAFVPALHLGRALEKTGDSARALRQYQALHESYPETPAVMLRLGALVARLENYEAGRALMEKAVVAEPELESLFMSGLAALADHFMTADDIARAAVLWRELSEMAPEEVLYQQRLADTLVVQGECEAAMRLYRNVLQRDPESSHAAGRIDALYEEQQDVEGRLSEWRELRQALPESVIPRLHFGMALEAAGQYDEARDVYDEALRNEPDNAVLKLRSGIMTALIEDYGEGRAMMDAALETKPDLARDAAAGLAAVAAHKAEEAQHKLAETLYREACALAPEEFWHRVRLGELLLKLGRADEASECFLEVLRARPESPHTAALLDHIYEEREDEQGRIASWREITEQYPEAATPHYHLGLAYEDSGMKEEALDAYIETLRINPDHGSAAERLERLLRHDRSSGDSILNSIMRNTSDL